MRNLLLGLLLVLATNPALALTPGDAGTFIAVGEDGQPMEKILRVTRTPKEWMFEDRQPDGSWLDVSCHGGCEHRDSKLDDLVRFFGAAPPPGMKPECIQNEQYAFCHLVKETPEQRREGYVLVVRINDDWLPVSLVRLPDRPDEPGAKRKPAPLESAGQM